MQPSGQGSWYVTYHRPDSIAPTRRGSCGDPAKIPGDPAWLGAREEGAPPKSHMPTRFAPVLCNNNRCYRCVKLVKLVTIEDPGWTLKYYLP